MADYVTRLLVQKPVPPGYLFASACYSAGEGWPTLRPETRAAQRRGGEVPRCRTAPS